METQKIINLLIDSSNEESKFATKKWHVIDSQTPKGKYNQNNSIKFETKNIKSSLCDYSDAFILVTGNITVNADSDTDVVFKNCRDVYRTAATSKVEPFVIIVNNWKPLTIIIKSSTLDVAAVLDPPLNCASFSTCKTEINDVFNDETIHIYIAMPIYNLIEYSDDYSDTSGSL